MAPYSIAGLFMMLIGYLTLKAMKHESKLIYAGAFVALLIFASISSVLKRKQKESIFFYPNALAMTGSALIALIFLVCYPIGILLLLCCSKKPKPIETEDFRHI